MVLRRSLRVTITLIMILLSLPLVPSCLKSSQQKSNSIGHDTTTVPLLGDETRVKVKGEVLTTDPDRTPLAILYREELKEYDFGPGHTFRGDRFVTFIDFLKENLREGNDYQIIRAEPASEKDLLLICEKEYIDFTKQYFSAPTFGASLPDEFIQFHSWDNMPLGKPGKVEEAARIVIGQAKLACDLVQEGKFQKVVSVGGGLHHAKRDYGEGFCIYNDVAFCGLYLLNKYNLERILILDTDAHAGNGTSEYFYDDPRVLFIDLHQEALYPFTGFITETGSGRGKGFKVNVPMPESAGDDTYRLVFESIIEPVTQEFKPQIIIWNGGSDAHFADELANLGLSVQGFKMIGDKVRGMANICDGKVIYLIASGYNNQVLPNAWLASTVGLGGIEVEVEEPVTVLKKGVDSAVVRIEKVIKEVRYQLKDYWTCFR